MSNLINLLNENSSKVYSNRKEGTIGKIKVLKESRNRKSKRSLNEAINTATKISENIPRLINENKIEKKNAKDIINALIEGIKYTNESVKFGESTAKKLNRIRKNNKKIYSIPEPVATTKHKKTPRALSGVKIIENELISKGISEKSAKLLCEVYIKGEKENAK